MQGNQGFEVLAPAYSYIRFSTPEQYKGDSFRRQIEAAQHYADENGLDLQNLSYRDLGVSGFKGKNLSQGALAQFKEQVKSGVIPSNSWLLIEAWDRFSRLEPKDALRQMLEMMEMGITIVTLIDEQVYTEDNLPMEKLLMCLVFMAKANAESVDKAKRVKAAVDKRQEKARAGKGRFTSLCPAWMKPNDNDGFDLIPERAEVVRLIFEKSIAGLGARAISRHLNDRGIAPFGRSKCWSDAYVLKLIKNPAAYGSYQPIEGRTKAVGDPIENYYPAAVEKDIALAAVHGVKSRSAKLGAKSGVHTSLGKVKLFLGLIRCGCGEPRLARNGGGGHHYYYCKNYEDGRGCEMRTVKQRPLDELVLYALSSFGYDSLINPDATRDNTVELGSLKQEFATVNSQIEIALDRLLTLNSQSLADRLTSLEKKKGELESKISALSRQDAAGRVSAASSEDIGYMLDHVFDIADGDNNDEKVKLALWIKSTVESVEVLDNQVDIHLKKDMPIDFDDQEPSRAISVYCLEDAETGQGLSWMTNGLSFELEKGVYVKRSHNSRRFKHRAKEE